MGVPPRVARQRLPHGDVADAELATTACRDALVQSARDRLRDAAVALGRHERLAHVARLRLRTVSERLAHTTQTLQVLTRARLVEVRERRCAALGEDPIEKRVDRAQAA